jgi:hypothetical protein
MRLRLLSAALVAVVSFGVGTAKAIYLIGGPPTGGDPAGATSHNNGNLDLTHADEVVPGFFLPKPNVWVYSGSRTISGPYRDGLSSEPWSGPAPTPVTTDGNLNPPSPDGCSGPDCGVFFKGFTGNPTDGAANVHITQNFAGTPGLTYILDGWAGAEANFLGNGVFAINFLNGGGGLISSASLDLTAQMHVANGQSFNYKEYSISGVAPAGTAFVQADVAMLNAMSNPAGGGQAYVVDDFTFQQVVPEPTALAVLGLSLGAAALRRRAG